MKKLLLSIVVLLSGLALAHAELESTTPEPGSIVTEPLAAVSLNFTEAIEVHFSLFKVYKLELEDFDPNAENAELRLNGMAGALVADVLEQQGDEQVRADTGVTTQERTSDTVTLALKEDLAPGYYVVMWRLLSTDTHSTQGFYTFQYAPAG